LATLFHRFYRQKKVMGDDPAVSAARLELVEATRQVIGRALGLMGLSIPTEGMYREGQKPRE
jgi:arginyl-tRNA synthetase